MPRKLQYSIESIAHLIVTENVKGRGDLFQRFPAAYSAAHRQHWLDTVLPIPEHRRKALPTAGKIATLPAAQPITNTFNVF